MDLCRMGIVLSTLAGCSVTPFSPPRDGGTDLAARDAAGRDLSNGSTDLAGGGDAATPGDLASPPDLTWDPSQPHPPQGATLCGQADFTAGDAATACMAPAFTLDHWGMADQPFPRDCGGVLDDGGEYQVYCTATTAYAWVHWKNLRASGTLQCKGQTPLLLSAVYEAGNGGGDTGANLQDGYDDVPEGFFDVNRAVEAYGWITVDVMDGGAYLWLAPLNAQLDITCGSQNSGYRTVVAGAAIKWTK
jgi:hypothetical protein